MILPLWLNIYILLFAVIC